MNQLSMSASAVIKAAPDQVYSTLADYQKGHPAIAADNFQDIKVEAGGYGAGTIITFRARLLGTERTVRHIISEPDPGRVLVETDTDAPITTTFTVTPLANGEEAEVNITTMMGTSKGLQGVVERLILPPVFKSIYRKELAKLSIYLQK